MTENGTMTTKQANEKFLEEVRMLVALRVQFAEQITKAEATQAEAFMALQNAIVEESKKTAGE